MQPNLVITASLMLALGLAGCASGGGESRQQVSGVLKGFDSGAEYATTQRCLSSFDYDNVDVLDDQHVLFTRSPGKEVWLNTLRSRCAGLDRNDTLLFTKTGNQLCNLDTVEAVEHFLFWRRTGPTCTLGKFNQLTENQAALLREATRPKG